MWEWLRLHIDPMHRVLRADEAEAAAWLCYAEGLLAGTTTVVDMWRYLDGAARAAEALGNRLVTVNYVGAHPDHDYFDTLDDNERMLREWTGGAGGRIMPWVGLEHPFYADEAGTRRAIAMANEFGTGLYTHCSESEVELAEFDERYGTRPMFALERLGFFDTPRTMIAHAVWLDDAEVALVAARGVSVSHNPVSNMKLASGMAPVAELRAAGVAVGLGTDGEKENNNLDMFEEMKVASLLGKLRKMDAAAMDSWEVLEMATVGGARAIGQADRLGSLEPGKQADLVAVRSHTPRDDAAHRRRPVRQPPPQPRARGARQRRRPDRGRRQGRGPRRPAADGLGERPRRQGPGRGARPVRPPVGLPAERRRASRTVRRALIAASGAAGTGCSPCLRRTLTG